MKTALVTFVPPTILGLLFPDGFLVAIGFAALAATVWAVIVPALMAYKSRQLFPESTGFRVIGGILPLIILWCYFWHSHGCLSFARDGKFTAAIFLICFDDLSPLREGFFFSD